MNIQAYIESGILEEYVLGTVSPQEKQEVECMSHIYPEIKEELLRTESALEEYALKHQTPPPASLKESLFAKMNFDSAQGTEDNNVEEHTGEAVDVQPTAVTGTIRPVAQDEPRVIDNVFDPVETKVVTPFWAKLAIAASVLLALFAGWSATQMSRLKQDNEEMASKMGTMEKEFGYAQSLASLYRNPEYKTVHLAGLEKSPQSSVSAFWHTATNQVLLDIQNLPKPPAGKQYQLWSIVDGKPVDIGMIDNEFSGRVLKMKNTKPGAVAFAITLEKEGGNPTPTMEEVYVMGKVV
ncbi:anti-sigma factor [Dyadobacter psychrophilus]|uniref:Anti-sigma-K factor rskA n=1 Tax=Dyadobacter psychrophilus TaxID=651661 RepID=A0A1T5GW61_9BACT|nr:anti-sigma factor [Dyadobacter psychrophilus]SKC12560.1 Anti-sigma-K factor rskA [Dyadobacter psychrophilus]